MSKQEPDSESHLVEGSIVLNDGDSIVYSPSRIESSQKDTKEETDKTTSKKIFAKKNLKK
jgi:hypothetical protein